MPYGSLYIGCEEHLDPAGTGSFYNEGEADIVVQHVFNLIYSGKDSFLHHAEVVNSLKYILFLMKFVTFGPGLLVSLLWAKAHCRTPTEPVTFPILSPFVIPYNHQALLGLFGSLF